MKSLLFNSNQNLRDKFPDESYCRRCGKPWSCCDSKSVPTLECRGTFATCEKCWNLSTLDELKQYYAEVYINQKESLIETKYTMDYTLQFLLDCVEKEFTKNIKAKNILDIMKDSIEVEIINEQLIIKTKLLYR